MARDANASYLITEIPALGVPRRILGFGSETTCGRPDTAHGSMACTAMADEQRARGMRGFFLIQIAWTRDPFF
jgi:hypothetical protein